MTTMRKLAAGVATGALALAVMTASAHAQETTGGINGAVRDAGRPVAGATVTVVYAPTNQTFTATTNADGQFSIRQLPPGGPYKVTTQDPSHPARVTEIGSIGLGAPFQLDVDYGEAAATADTGTGLSEVVVTASRAGPRQVQTGPRSTFNATDIETLPSFSRDLRDVARLNPFVQIDPSNQQALIIAGTNNRFNALYVDGVRQSDDFGLNANGYPTQRSPISTELVQSLNVEVAPYDVQYGAFQGGVLNLVTKSGSNDFHGSAFYEYDSRGLGAGEQIRDRQVILNFKDKQYGFFLGGPIVRDKLFFQFGYEKYEGLTSVSYGPQDASGVTNVVSGVTNSDVVRVQNALRTRYGYNAGGFGITSPIQSEKWFGKLTWQINDQHRFAFIAQNTNDSNFNQPASSNTTLGLDSTTYLFEQPLATYSGYLYSNWTPNLSTEISYTYRTTDGITNNTGAPFPNFQVFLNGALSGSAIRAGQDTSRQANSLQTTSKLLRAKGSYAFNLRGAHTLTAGYEREELDLANVFVQNALGTYQFSSIANLENGIASTFTYANAASGNVNDGSAIWGDVVHTGYVQDEWRPLSNLTLRGGVRVEYYEQADLPKNNPLFQNRYGFSNSQNLDGKVVVMPRIGFNYRPLSNLVINGGVGLFSGGNPNVWISNNFSGTGNILGQVSCTTSSPASLCGNALNPVIVSPTNPAVVASNAASANAGTGVTNVLDPNFEPPSVWKASIGAAYTANFADWAWTGPVGRFVGNDWRFHGDYLYTTVENAVLWRDLQTVNAVIGTAPDGRPIFDPARAQASGTRPARGNNTYDLVLTNTNKGRGEIWALGFGKTFDWGLDFDVTYTRTDTKDVNPGTSSVALSNYRQVAFSDPNNPALATSNYSIRNSVKAQINYEHKFIGDYATRVRFFIQRRSGLPYSFTFNNTQNATAFQNDAFGLSNAVSNTTQLFYVPAADSAGNVTLTSDPKVAYVAGFDIASFNQFLKQSGLTRYAGSISPRNAFTSRDVTLADVQFTQEIPGFFPQGAKGELYFSIFNVGNLLNNGWGVIDQIGFPYTATVVTPTIRPCGPTTGCAPGQTNQYVYQPINRATGFGQLPVVQTGQSGQPPASLWALKIGVRYKF